MLKAHLTSFSSCSYHLRNSLIVQWYQHQDFSCDYQDLVYASPAVLFAAPSSSTQMILHNRINKNDFTTRWNYFQIYLYCNKRLTEISIRSWTNKIVPLLFLSSSALSTLEHSVDPNVSSLYESLLSFRE